MSSLSACVGVAFCCMAVRPGPVEGARDGIMAHHSRQRSWMQRCGVSCARYECCTVNLVIQVPRLPKCYQMPPAEVPVPALAFPGWLAGTSGDAGAAQWQPGTRYL